MQKLSELMSLAKNQRQPTRIFHKTQPIPAIFVRKDIAANFV
jgi:hypothetical protein